MKPYVYIIQNIEKTHWYVGMRSANECPANEDTGYWGSSKYLKKLIKKTGKENWTKTIVAEFNTLQEASAHEVELLELMWDWDGRVNKNINGCIDMSDPEVKSKYRAGIQKRGENQVWRKNHIDRTKKLAQDPEWIAKNKAAREAMYQDPVWKANNRAGALKRAKPFIATCITTGREYYCESTVCEQAKSLNFDHSTVSSCLNGKSKQHKGFTFRYV